MDKKKWPNFGLYYRVFKLKYITTPIMILLHYITGGRFFLCIHCDKIHKRKDVGYIFRYNCGAPVAISVDCLNKSLHGE